MKSGIMLVFNSFDSFLQIAIICQNSNRTQTKLLEFSQKLRKTCKSERELLFQNVLLTLAPPDESSCSSCSAGGEEVRHTYTEPTSLKNVALKSSPAAARSRRKNCVWRECTCIN